MVDVSPKGETERAARARAVVHLREETRALIAAGQVPKGDVLAAARLAGIMAAKRTPDLIPLCHPLRITGAEVQLDCSQPGQVVVEAEVRAFDRTGVEMEALVAASAAALTIYDMCKAVDRWMRIDGVTLVEKRGGRSGPLRNPDLLAPGPTPT